MKKILDDAIEGLKGEVDRARDNVQVIVPQVQTWLEDSKKIKDEISRILSEATNVEIGCLKLGARFSLSRRAKKTTDRIKEHRGQKNFDSISQPGPPPATQAVPGGKTYEFVSRKKIEEDIMTTLRCGDVNLIGIYGMGGLGKTTMAQKIRNRVLNENVFQEVVMTVVSQQVDISKIQVEIGRELGLEIKEETSQGKVQKLHARLSGTKKILVILDDVWEGLELENLGIPCDSKGCTILITSRNSDALSAMGFNVENKIFGMEILSEEEAWYFFREGAGTCVDDTNLNSIAKEVVKECRGLPIALKALGLALKDKNNASIWNNALRKLKQCDADIPNYIKKVYTPLILSYDFLDSKKAKSLFLLCCLFPEDYDIPLEHLTYFCMGLGIFGGIINVEDARNETCSLTDFLKSRSLLLDSNQEDHVRMHDVVRDVCIFIAKREGCIGGNNCSWISSSQFVGERNELLTESRFPNLRLLSLRLLSLEEFKFGSAFLEGIKDLYVLCIDRYWKLTSLPYPTHSPINLKTLLLASCSELKSISVVGKLRNLEILICRDCGLIEELPLEMKGLNRLKLLELTWCKKLQSIGRGIISSLVGLEELKMRRSFVRWEAEDREERENAGLRELEALTNLRCLEIEIRDPALAAQNMQLSSKLTRFNIMIAAPGFSGIVESHHKKMYLRLEGESCLGDWIEMELLRDTEGMYLSGNGANNVDLAKCQNIQSLMLWECKTMKSIIRTSILVDDATPFPLIENLELWQLPELEEIWDGPISSNSFQKLKTLGVEYSGLKQFWKSSSQNNHVPLFSNLSSIEISYCHRLRNLGQLSIAGKDCLPQLEQLHIRDCKKMEQVFLWNNEKAGKNKNSIESRQNRHVITKVFPKLKEVKLLNLPNLTTFYQGIQGIEFPLLREMMIEECPKMKSSIYECDRLCNLGHLSIAGKDCLPQLEQLCIRRCEMMEQVFLLNDKETGHNKGSIESRQNHHVITKVFPKLKEVKLFNLPNLTTFYQGIEGIEFPLLRELSIYDCPKMKNIIIGSNENSSREITSSSADIDDDDDDDDDYLHLFCQSEKVSFGSNLEVLKINHHNPFCGHEIPSSSLFNGLKELTINKYVNSMSLLTLSVAANLVSLTELRIRNCDEMIKVIEDEQQLASGSERILLFPKLEKLYLEYLPKLVTFCDWKCEVELPSLTKVEIYKCPNMESLSLGLVATPKLEAFSTDLTTYVGVGVDVAFNSLKEFAINRNKNPLYHHKISVFLFNGLEKLTFYRYKGSRSLFSSLAVGNLVNLRVLEINDCDLVKVIEDEEEKEDGKVVSGVVLPKLEELRLVYLPKLVRFCEWKCDVELLSLTKVWIEHCPNMENFSMGFVAAPNLKIVEIGHKEIDSTKDLNGVVQQHYIARLEKDIKRRMERKVVKSRKKERMKAMIHGVRVRVRVRVILVENQN